MLIVGGVSGFSIRDHLITAHRNVQRRRVAEVQANGDRLRAPLWATPFRCVPSTEIERRQDEAMFGVLEDFPYYTWSPASHSAVSYFAHPGTRDEVPSQQKLSSPRCARADMFKEISNAALKAGVFDAPFLFEDELALAEQLGPRDPRIVQAVARSAFNDSEIPSNVLRHDLRPYARLVLAEYGEVASPWLSRALSEMSTSSKLGVGAAQIAAAARPALALPRIQEMMDGLLLRSRSTGVVTIEDRDKLYGLAFALGMAGTVAQPYARPLSDLLARQVQSRAPPFGLVELPPKRMCSVAEHIGGDVAEHARRSGFCTIPLGVLEE